MVLHSEPSLKASLSNERSALWSRDPVSKLPGGLHSDVHVLLVPLRHLEVMLQICYRSRVHLADLLLGGRVEGCEGLAADRVHPLVVDEELRELDLGARHLASL